MNGTILSIQNLDFGYTKENLTIQDFSLDVYTHSFTTLLGESGCGKTTILRLISGFLSPVKGRIIIDGKDMTKSQTNERNVGIVFQDYALFPHLRVRDNIAYGLRLIKGCSRDEVKSRSEAAASMMGLASYMDRYPHELSGGQQQRVALARSIVLNPQILLMDEPLSSLDARLKESVRYELKELQHKTGITTIYVTHDQEEAMSLSDYIAVIKDGRICQYDTPENIYYKPQDKYTADFMGKANFVNIKGEEYLVRPQWLELSDDESKADIKGIIQTSLFMGDKTRFVIRTDSGDDKSITADLPTLKTLSLDKGRPVNLCINHKWKM